MKTSDLDILLGLLGDPRDGLRVGHVDGKWTLATGEEGLYEELVAHESWDEFVKLIAEYSDFAPGDSGDSAGES